MNKIEELYFYLLEEQATLENKLHHLDSLQKLNTNEGLHNPNLRDNIDTVKWRLSTHNKTVLKFNKIFKDDINTLKKRLQNG